MDAGLVDWVIEEAADSSGACTCRLDLQMQDRIGQVGFPGQTPVEPGTLLTQGLLEFHYHTQLMGLLSRAGLTATDRGRQAAIVATRDDRG